MNVEPTYDDQNPLTKENAGGGAIHSHHVLFVGVMTSGYSRPLGPYDIVTQRFGGDSRDRLVQRETDGVNWDILVRGGVFQERTLKFRVYEAFVYGSKCRTHENASGKESAGVNVSQCEPNSSRGQTTNPPPIRSAISTCSQRRVKLGMTYGDEQVGLEYRNALCGLPDEFMDIVVGSP